MALTRLLGRRRPSEYGASCQPGSHPTPPRWRGPRQTPFLPATLWPTPVEQHPGGLGLTYGGQREFLVRLIQGFDARLHDCLVGSVEGLDAVQMQLRLSTFTLQESVDFATFLVRTTIDAQRFISGLRGVGGEINVATITAADGFRFVQRKEPRGDAPLQWHNIGTADGGVTDSPPDGVRPAAHTGFSRGDGASVRGLAKSVIY